MQSQIDERVVVSSSALKTNQISGTFRVSGLYVDGQSTLSVRADFKEFGRPDETVIELTGEDAVYCDGIRLSPDVGLSNGSRLPRKPVGVPYRFELRRAGGESVFVDVMAVDEVEILAPAPETQLRRREPLPVQWTPAIGTTAVVQLFSNCAMTHAEQETESGTITLPAFEPTSAGPNGPQNAANAPCDGNISLLRTREGDMTSALAATHIVAEEFHHVPVRVTD